MVIRMAVIWEKSMKTELWSTDMGMIQVIRLTGNDPETAGSWGRSNVPGMT